MRYLHHWGSYTMLFRAVIRFSVQTSALRACDRRSMPLVLLLVLVSCGSNPQQYIDNGGRLLAEGKYQDAELAFRKALQVSPKNGDAVYGLGKTLLQENRLAEAYKTLEEASQLLPTRVDVKVTLGDLALAIYYLDRSQKPIYDQIVKLAQDILAQNPQSPDGLRLKGYLALADRKTKEAVDAFRSAAAQAPGDGKVAVGLCQALLQDGQLAEGEKEAFRLLEKDKAHLAVYDLLYFEYVRRSRPADAVKILERKIANNPKDSGAILQLASHHARSKDLPGMEKALKYLISNPKDFPQAELQAGDLYASERMWAEALQHYEAGARSMPADRALYYSKMAAVHNALGRKAEALQSLDIVLKEKPGDKESRALRAGLLLESSKAADRALALTELQALAKELPQDSSIQSNLGRAHFFRGNLSEARQAFGQALRILPESLPPRFGMAEVALNEGKNDEAIKYTDEILAIDKNNAPARLLRATAFRKMGRLNEARAELARLRALAPTWRETEIESATLALTEKRYVEAEQTFRKLEQQGTSGDRPTIGLANVYLAQGKLDQALALVAASIKKNPDSWELRNVFANIALQARKFDQAQEQYREMLRISPDSVETRLLSGEAYRQQGDLANAARVFEEVSKASPNNVPALMMMATTQQMAGRISEAQKTYRRVIELTPGNAIALNNLAYLLVDTGGDLNEAERLSKAALQLVPNQPNYMDTLGVVYMKKGLNDSALQLFSNLVKQYPNAADYRYHLALALVAKGDSAQARRELQQAAAKASADPALAAKIKELLGKVG